MISNPFTPAEIASGPNDFFGRAAELLLLERSLRQGSVAIQGAVGIGRSSLLSRIRMIMDGWESDYSCVSFYATAHPDIKTIDDAARIIVESLVDIDETTNKITLKLPKIIGFESSHIVRYFVEGRHLNILIKLLEKEHLDLILNDNELLIIAIDEADKAPIALARLIRSLQTHLQQVGVNRVRFCMAGGLMMTSLTYSLSHRIVDILLFLDIYLIIESFFCQIIKAISGDSS